MWKGKTRETPRKTYPDPVSSITKPNGVTETRTRYDHRLGLGVRSVPLIQWARVRSPVGTISWLRFLRGFPSTARQMSGNLGHNRPRLSYGHNIPSKPYTIRLRTATVSINSSSTWTWLNNRKQQRTRYSSGGRRAPNGLRNGSPFARN